jgi:mannose-6-phosphate isomerase-like protein (cupin superfamily)
MRKSKRRAGSAWPLTIRKHQRGHVMNESTRSSLAAEMDRHIATFATRREDWDVFGLEIRLDPRYARAQRRYVGASGSVEHADPNAIAAGAFTLTIMMQPGGHETPLHRHEVEEVFFVLEGECTVIWERDGEVCERRLGKWDMAFSPAGHVHGIRNHTGQPCYFQVMLGKAKPNRPAYVDPELRRLQKETHTL